MLFDLKSIIPETKSSYPFMNESTAIIDYITTRPTKTFENLDFWIERTPEALAIINAIVTDLRADGVRFEGGKQAINKAEYFAKTNFFPEEFFAYLWDWVKYGDAYEWIGGVQAWLDANKKINELGLEIDEDFPQALKTIPANTVDIMHNGKVITEFKQWINSRPSIVWPVKDVIHGALLPNKGKVYGFSPSQASLTEMNILGYLKDYAGTFFKNGGVPDWMFVLPNEMAGSPNHKRLIQMLQEYKSPQMKHGNLVFAGEVNPTQIGQGLDKIDISSLVILLTSTLALAHNMPVSRVAAVIGAEVKVSSGGDDLANEGYWSSVNERQDRLENWFNTQLWEPYFDVKMKINRAWKTNEIKEQQRNQFAIGNVSNLNIQLARYDKQLKLEWIKRQMYLSDEDLELANPEFKELAMMGGGAPGGKQPDNTEVSKGAATESHRDQKRKQVNPNQDFSGKGFQFKSKKTILCDKVLFFDKFETWVKNSKTRDLYFFVKNNVMNASFSTPEENFDLVIPVKDLNPSEMQEIKGNGRETAGVI